MAGYSGKIGLGATQKISAPIDGKVKSQGPKKRVGGDLRTGK